MKVNAELQKIISNIGWLFGDRILRLGVNLIITAWVARYLQPGQFGLFSYALAFVALVGIFATLSGLDQIVMREIIRDESAKNELIGTAFLLRFGGALISILLSYLAILLFRPNDPLVQLLVIIVSTSLLVESFNVIDLWFQRQVQSRYTVIARNVAFVVMTAVRIILVTQKAPLVAFVCAYVLENTLGAIGLIIAYRANGQSILKWRVSITRAIYLLKECWPLVLSGLAILVYLRIDQVMLGQLADDRAVGIYSVVIRMSEVWYFIPTAIISSVTPSVLETREVSQEHFYGKLQKIFNLMAILAFAIAIPMTFLSTFIVTLIFGQGYAAAGNVLSIHIWAALFVFFGWTKGMWIVAEGETVFALVSTVCGAMMNILLNFWLIPKYQEKGAAIATVLSYGLTDYVFCFIYPPARKLAKIMTKAIMLDFLISKLPFKMST